MQSIWRMRYFSSLMVLMLAGLRASSAGYTYVSVFLTSVSSVPIFSIFSSLSTLVSPSLSSLLWDLHVITYQSNWEMKYSVLYIGSPSILKKARVGMPSFGKKSSEHRFKKSEDAQRS